MACLRAQVFSNSYEKNFIAINTEPQWGECFCLLFIKWSSLEWKKNPSIWERLWHFIGIFRNVLECDISKSNDESMAPFFTCFLCGILKHNCLVMVALVKGLYLGVLRQHNLSNAHLCTCVMIMVTITVGFKRECGDNLQNWQKWGWKQTYLMHNC